MNSSTISTVKAKPKPAAAPVRFRATRRGFLHGSEHFSPGDCGTMDAESFARFAALNLVEAVHDGGGLLPKPVEAVPPPAPVLGEGPKVKVLSNARPRDGYTHCAVRGAGTSAEFGQELELTSKVACDCLSVGSVVLVEGQTLAPEWQSYLEKLYVSGGKGAKAPIAMLSPQRRGDL